MSARLSLARLILSARLRCVTPGFSRLLESSHFLLLIGRERLVDLGEGRTSNGRKLTDFATLG